MRDALIAAKPDSFGLPVGFDQSEAYRMIVCALDQGCSDIKVQSNDYITVYWRRSWYSLTTRVLDDGEAKKILRILAGPDSITKIGSGGEVDEDPEFYRPGGDRELVRLRLHAIAARVGGVKDGVSITLRTIPSGLPELAKQSLPQGVQEDILIDRGLVLVSGATGSGKTTLIASALHERTKESPAPSIQTFEEPTEITYDKAGLGSGPLVAQASIGRHLKSWERAAPAAMRSKPDILLMGEVRDKETADRTVEMATTGHAVYATIHADTPQETMFRLVEMFPSDERSAAAAKMLGALRLICSRKIVALDSGFVVPLTAWIAFDSRIKDALQSEEWPYPRWARFVREYTAKHGQDFASQCIPYISKGEMSLKQFREITQMGRDEAYEFFAKVTS
ncbi:ATPase, T2SS/T4P/T4SS family [Duganella sp. LjRoot269]|uniref:ATPase, T2SS/T4P/T4SS family n=1 Tax=Duganella sp. LjRoot269 TaxID=3342305 RepID=UPI003ED0EA94